MYRLCYTVMFLCWFYSVALALPPSPTVPPELRNCKPGFMMKAPPHYSNILATAIPARIQEILCQDRADPRTLAELKELVRPPHSDWFLDLPPDLQWWVYLQMFEAKGIDVSWIPGYQGGGDFNPSDHNLQDILKWKFPAETRTRTKEFKTKAPASGTATDSGFSTGATVPSSTRSSDEESSILGKDEDFVSLKFVQFVIVAIGGLGLVGGLVWYVKKKRAEANRILEVGSIASEDSALALRVLLDANEACDRPGTLRQRSRPNSVYGDDQSLL